jgi:hypothetical protein
VTRRSEIERAALAGHYRAHTEEALRVKCGHSRAEVNTYMDLGGRSSAYFQAGHASSILVRGRFTTAVSDASPSDRPRGLTMLLATAEPTAT